MEGMIQTFQADLESLREQHEALKTRIAGSALPPVEGEAKGSVLPEEPRETVFQVIGITELQASSNVVGEPESKPLSAYATTTRPEGEPQRRQTSIFAGKSVEPIQAKAGIFRRAVAEAIPVGKVSAFQATAETPLTLGEGLSAPPSTPTTGFLPMVQPISSPSLSVSTATQAPTSEEGFSETLEVVPESIQAPAVAAKAGPKTYLLPWSVQEDPVGLRKLVDWMLRTLILPEDRVKLLISGELIGSEGGEAEEGHVSHLIGNETFAAEKEELRSQFPVLIGLLEETGLDRIPFQVEIRRQESMGWSVLSELQWPHVFDQMVILCPCGLKTPAGVGLSAEPLQSFVLRTANCPVIEFPVES